jgi:DNA polymerase I
MPSKKLFLLDAMALIYRAHFAFSKNPRISSTGLNTSAIFGFVNTMLEVIQKEKPTHLGVAFDLPGPTFRHIEYPLYKAQRQEQPEDISTAIPYIKRIVEAMNIPLLMLSGFEADDVIGTIAKEASKHDFEVFMYTPDKDYGQLVEENIFLYKPAFMGNDIQIMGVKEICDKWKIKRVDQVVDLLGLMGDAVDNIPGIPSVGEKTAQKLIEEFDSVENIIANAANIKGKLGENIRNFAEQGRLSKKLALIDILVPVTFVEEDLILSKPNEAVLSPILDELEFRTLKKRILGVEDVKPVAKPKATAGQFSLFDNPSTIQNVSVQPENVESEQKEDTIANISRRNISSVVHNYQTISNEFERKDLVRYLMAQDAIVFDTETTSTESTQAELVGLSFAYIQGEAFYVPIPPTYEEAIAILEDFKPVFEAENIEKIGQNIKYDILVLKNYQIEIKGNVQDTMIAHYLIEPEQKHGMDFMANTLLNYDPVSITTLIGEKGKNQGSMRDVSIEIITEYAAEDADITLQLHEYLKPKIQENNLQKLYTEVEMPMVKVLADVEFEGVKIDIDVLAELSKTLEGEIQVYQKDIHELAGMEFNIASPKQLGDVLFEKLKLDDKAKKTKTGQYQTGEEILSLIEDKHPIITKILDFRELVKLKNTYIDALPLMINPKTGRIHTSFNQTVAATGRLSSTNPNLQNIPIRTPRGQEIRKAFIPRSEDFQILSADYSQIELRIMAAFSGDESMLAAYNNGIDIHSNTASKVFKVALDEVSSDMRRKAKMVNFGIIYGISAFGLAQRLQIPRGEAKEIIEAYWAEFPNIKTYMDLIINQARENKYVETILGRKRFLPNINSQNQTERGFAERNAINAPIQGSAADLIKVAMVNIHQEMKKMNMKSKMILTVHDELVFDAHNSEIEVLKELVERLMTTAIPMKVPIEVSLGIGKNWLEAH